MFSHHHYWPQSRAYQKQEEMLAQARAEQLLRDGKSAGRGQVARIAAVVEWFVRRFVSRNTPATEEKSNWRAVPAARRSQ